MSLVTTTNLPGTVFQTRLARPTVPGTCNNYGTCTLIVTFFPPHPDVIAHIKWFLSHPDFILKSTYLTPAKTTTLPGSFFATCEATTKYPKPRMHWQTMSVGTIPLQHHSTNIVLICRRQWFSTGGKMNTAREGGSTVQIGSYIVTLGKSTPLCLQLKLVIAWA